MNEAALAVSAAVAMHVVWNLIARHQPRNSFPLWWVLLSHLVLLGPWGLYMLLSEVQWTPHFMALLMISASANVIYFLGLRKAYDSAPVALVYPLVRSSPLLIALWSTLLFGESLGFNSWLGIMLSVAGQLWIANTGKTGGDGQAVPWALLAMLATSVYSLSDKAATTQIASFGGLVGFITVGYFASWLSMTIALRKKTGFWMPRERIRLPAFVIGGLCVGLAYALVIQAMRFMPSAEVVAYTNTGIVIASLASIMVFKERHDWRRRIFGAVVICAGLLIMST